MFNPESAAGDTPGSETPGADPPEKPPKKSESTRRYPVRDYDVVQAVIGRLDESLQETKDRFK